MMQLQTLVEKKKAEFEIKPTDRILFVGSCFADKIGGRFTENCFNALVNPYGVMYNPASILHTVEKTKEPFDVAVFTLGTNHVYIFNETGEIVDNCLKRPQRLFTEKELNIDECAEYLNKAIDILHHRNPDVKVVFTVSPIRYQKYGLHESQLSKAILLLAVNKVVKGNLDSSLHSSLSYFPAYEIMNDELRDYRFYQPDMLHPSEQAVDYIYERFTESFFSNDALLFQKEWQPIHKALSHRPFNPDSDEYKAFYAKAKDEEQNFRTRWKIR